MKYVSLTRLPLEAAPSIINVSSFFFLLQSFWEEINLKNGNLRQRRITNFLKMSILKRKKKLFGSSVRLAAAHRTYRINKYDNTCSTTHKSTDFLLGNLFLSDLELFSNTIASTHSTWLQLPARCSEYKTPNHVTRDTNHCLV